MTDSVFSFPAPLEIFYLGGLFLYGSAEKIWWLITLGNF